MTDELLQIYDIVFKAVSKKGYKLSYCLPDEELEGRDNIYFKIKSKDKNKISRIKITVSEVM